MLIGWSRHSTGRGGQVVDYLAREAVEKPAATGHDRPADALAAAIARGPDADGSASAIRLVHLSEAKRRTLLRRPAPEVILGSPELVAAAIDAPSFRPRKHRYACLTLSFAAGDLDAAAHAAGDPDVRQVVDEVAAFVIEAAFAGIPSSHRPPVLIVTHTHTGRLEINVLIPRWVIDPWHDDGRTRAWHPHPPRADSRVFWCTLEAALNAAYGWADPQDPRAMPRVQGPSWGMARAAEGARAAGRMLGRRAEGLLLARGYERFPDPDPRVRITAAARAIAKDPEVIRPVLLDRLAPVLREAGYEVAETTARDVTFVPVEEREAEEEGRREDVAEGRPGTEAGGPGFIELQPIGDDLFPAEIRAAARRRTDLRLRGAAFQARPPAEPSPNEIRAHTADLALAPARLRPLLAARAADARAEITGGQPGVRLPKHPVPAFPPSPVRGPIPASPMGRLAALIDRLRRALHARAQIAALLRHLADRLSDRIAASGMKGALERLEAAAAQGREREPPGHEVGIGPENPAEPQAEPRRANARDCGSGPEVGRPEHPALDGATTAPRDAQRDQITPRAAADDAPAGP